MSSVAQYIVAARRALGPLTESALETLSLLAGAGGIAYGAYAIYRPAGFIVGGILLIAGVLLRARGNG